MIHERKKMNITSLKSYRLWALLGVLFVLPHFCSAAEENDPYAMIKSKDSSQRRAAVHQLGDIQDERSQKTLFKMLNDKDPLVRSAAIESLQRQKSVDALDEISGLLINDPDRDVRRMAAFSLGKQKDRRAVPFLIQALKDPEPNVRVDAVSSLRRLKAREAVDPLLEFLNKDDKRMKKHVILVLGKIGGEKAVPAIEKALTDEDDGVREAANLALGDLTSRSSIDKIKPLLTDENVRVRLAAAQTLARMQDTSGLSVCLEAFDSKDNAIINRALRLLGLVGNRSHISVINTYRDDDAYKTSAKIARERIEIRFPKKKKSGKK